ncbi:MAG: Mut7-C RNAse domain-containing protein [Planctomycetes bacterium]|nr:Mut7-C RNAse domain-containing protein [Planctomycetota bacterium]
MLVRIQQNSNMPRVACDAMLGGLARWLRMFGVDTTYTPDIDDGELIRQALAEARTVVSSDHKLFERRRFTTGELNGLVLPVGLKLREQVRFASDRLALKPGFPRCAACNGELFPVARAEVGDVVPARSLIWVREFYRCERCEHVFWEGSHWRRIGPERAALKRQTIDRKQISAPKAE